MFTNDEINRLFKKMSGSFFNLDDLFEGAGTGAGKPLYYGYTMTVGPDGNPVIREFGNTKSGHLETDRQPLVDTILDEKEKVVKLVAEMPGVEKADIKVVVNGKTVHIDAERGEKRYHANVPLNYKVKEDSAKASYKNGILELVLDLAEPPKPEGKTVEVQ